MKLPRRIILVALFLISMHSVALACSCIPFDANKSYERAIYVFEAYLTKSEIIEVPNQGVAHWEGMGNYFVTGNFNIVKTWKGNPEQLAGVITHTEGSACGIALIPGNNYLFFIYEEWEQKKLLFDKKYGVVSWCGSPFSGNYKLYSSTLKWLDKK